MFRYSKAVMVAAALALTGCAGPLSDKPVEKSQESVREKAPSLSLEIEQLTTGPKHHFFGYIGQSLTIPWSGNGRWILGMEIDRIDRLPKPEEYATIMVVDTKKNNKIVRLDRPPEARYGRPAGPASP